MRRPSLAGISDPQARKAIEFLVSELIALEERMGKAISAEGVMSAHLPTNVKKETSDGIKAVPAVNEVTSHVGGEDVAAGALATGDDLDDVPDGSSYGRVGSGELTSGQVTRVKKTGGNVSVDDILDVGNNDLDDLPDGSSYGRVGSGELTSGQVTRVKKTGGNVSVDDILDVSNNDFDDVPDGTTYKRLAAVDASHQAAKASLGAAIVSGDKLDYNGVAYGSTLGAGSYLDLDQAAFELRVTFDSSARFECRSHSSSRESWYNDSGSNQAYTLTRTYVDVT